MAVYNSAMKDEAIGSIDYDTDTFYVLLVGAGYTFDRKLHTKRSDITDEVVADGYTEGGQAAAIVVDEDTANDRTDIGLGGAVWNPSTIAANGAVYYKRRGGAASADELVYYNDFGMEVTSTNAAFTLASSTIRKQNT